MFRWNHEFLLLGLVGFFLRLLLLYTFREYCKNPTVYLTHAYCGPTRWIFLVLMNIFPIDSHSLVRGRATQASLRSQCSMTSGERMIDSFTFSERKFHLVTLILIHLYIGFRFYSSKTHRITFYIYHWWMANNIYSWKWQ